MLQSLTSDTSDRSEAASSQRPQCRSFHFPSAAAVDAAGIAVAIDCRGNFQPRLRIALCQNLQQHLRSVVFGGSSKGQSRRTRCLNVSGLSRRCSHKRKPEVCALAELSAPSLGSLFTYEITSSMPIAATKADGKCFTNDKLQTCTDKGSSARSVPGLDKPLTVASVQLRVECLTDAHYQRYTQLAVLL